MLFSAERDDDSERAKAAKKGLAGKGANVKIMAVTPRSDTSTYMIPVGVLYPPKSLSSQLELNRSFDSPQIIRISHDEGENNNVIISAVAMTTFRPNQRSWPHPRTTVA